MVMIIVAKIYSHKCRALWSIMLLCSCKFVTSQKTLSSQMNCFCAYLLFGNTVFRKLGVIISVFGQCDWVFYLRTVCTLCQHTCAWSCYISPWTYTPLLFAHTKSMHAQDHTVTHWKPHNWEILKSWTQQHKAMWREEFALEQQAMFSLFFSFFFPDKTKKWIWQSANGGYGIHGHDLCT